MFQICTIKVAVGACLNFFGAGKQTTDPIHNIPIINNNISD